jgi:uncharacterized protein
VHYLDASALFKLCCPERESAALDDWLDEHPGAWITSALSQVELTRAVARTHSSALGRVPIVLARCDQLEIDGRVGADASVVAPPELRSLDAIHLATALQMSADLETLITYDIRLADAAKANGLRVAAPS